MILKDEEVIGKLDRGEGYAYIRIPAAVLRELVEKGRSLGRTTVTLENITQDGSSGNSGDKVRRVAGVDVLETQLTAEALTALSALPPVQVLTVAPEFAKGTVPEEERELRYRTIVDKVYSSLVTRYSAKIAVVQRKQSDNDIRTRQVPLTRLDDYLNDETVVPNAKDLTLIEVNRRRIALNKSLNETLHQDEKRFLRQYWAAKLLPFFEDIEGVTVQDIAQNYHAYRLMKVFGFYNANFKKDITRLLGFRGRETEMIVADAIASNWFVDKDKIGARLAGYGDKWVSEMPFDLGDIVRIDLERLILGVEEQDYALLRMSCAGNPLIGNMGFPSNIPHLVTLRNNKRMQDENMQAVLETPARGAVNKYISGVENAEWYEALRLEGVKLDRAAASEVERIARASVQNINSLGVGFKELVKSWNALGVGNFSYSGPNSAYRQIEALNSFMLEKWNERLGRKRDAIEKTEKIVLDRTYMPLQFRHY